MLTILVYILFKMGMLAMTLSSVKTIIFITVIIDVIVWIFNN